MAQSDVSAVDDERRPLLSARKASATDTASACEEAGQHGGGLRELLSTRPVPLLFLLVVVIDFGGQFCTVTQNMAYELAICARHAGQLGPDGCKSVVVQKELAFIKGWGATAEAMATVLVAFFYGRLADSIGRVPVLRWSMMGISGSCLVNFAVCYWSNVFPTRLVWLSALPLLFGGGLGVFNALLCTIIADVASEKTRSLGFSFLFALLSITNMAAMPVVSALMDVDVWTTIVIGNALVLSSILLTCWLPETLEEPDLPPEEQPTEPLEDLSIPRRLKASISSVFSGDFSFLWSSWSIPILISGLLFTNIGRYAEDMLSQYSHKRFGWDWSRTNYIVMFFMFMNTLQMLLVLPWLNAVIDNTLKWVPAKRDLWLARFLIIVFTIGMILLGLSATPVVLHIAIALSASGVAYKIVVRSILTSLVEKHHIAALYNLISTAEVGSDMLSGPILAQAFQTGLDRGGFWLGLPFFVSGCFLVLTTLGTWVVRVPKAVRDGEEEQCLQA